MRTITIKASKTYDVIIGPGLLKEAGNIIRKKLGGETAAIITDSNVAPLYAKALADSLALENYRIEKYVFPHSECSKNAETFLSILNFLAENKFSRSDIIVALGGGVTGDLAGFAAASYMRGIRFVQIPTTVLAAVDSSVGGKTGINLPAGKNLAGAFYQPGLVLCDTDTFSTLPEDVFRDGCAEMIKHGMIADSELFHSYKTPIHTQLETAIARNIEIKRDIVCADEFESGRRKLLNLGHTAGHAIELLSGYKTPHGHAVAAGMALITRAAVRLGLCKEACLTDLLDMLTLYKLPLNTSYKADELARACLSDKKRDGKSLTMVFPLETGNCILKEVPVSELEELIRLGLDGNQ